MCDSQDFPDFPDGPSQATCETTTCPPAATCRQKETYVYCECPYGFTGVNCDMPDPCLPRVKDCPKGAQCFGECNPNVVCNGATGIPQCAGCVTGWTGPDCRTDQNECVVYPDICLNGGKCVNEDGDYSCECPTGWTGKDCFCRKGTACDVADVREKDQYSSGMDSNVNPPMPDTVTESSDASKGRYTTGSNSAETNIRINTNLVFAISFVVLSAL